MIQSENLYRISSVIIEVSEENGDGPFFKEGNYQELSLIS